MHSNICFEKIEKSPNLGVLFEKYHLKNKLTNQMNFQAETVYHLYNQGNNKQIIFPRHQNYLFFLEKMRKHLMPFADILCYCLMPNHFHWLLYVKPEGAEIFVPKTSTGGSTLSGTSSRSFLPRQNLNQSIGIMLSSYNSSNQ
jgi:putative transposase